MKIKFNPIYITLILITLISLFAYFILAPLYSDISGKRAAIDSKQQELKSLSEKIAHLETLSKDSVKLDEVTRVTKSLLPAEDNTSNFIVLLEEFANQEGLILSNLSIAENKKGNLKNITGANTIEFSFNTETDFQKTIRILEDLERFTRLNILTSLALTKQTNSDALAIKITGYIFYE